MNLKSKTDAARVSEILDKSLKAIRDAYRWVNPDPYLESLLGGNGQQAIGPAPAYLTSHRSTIMHKPLQRLGGGSVNSFGFF